MRTVKIVLALTVVAMFTMGLGAQETPKKKGQRVKLNPVSQAMVRIERLHAELRKMDLSEEQKEKLKGLHEASGPQMKSAMEQTAEILGEEKMKTAQEVGKEAKEAGKTPWQVAVEVEAALKLNDEQTEKLAKVGKELMAIQRGMMKEVKSILTPEQNKELAAKMAPQKKGNKKGAKKGNKKQNK